MVEDSDGEFVALTDHLDAMQAKEAEFQTQLEWLRKQNREQRHKLRLQKEQLSESAQHVELLLKEAAAFEPVVRFLARPGANLENDDGRYEAQWWVDETADGVREYDFEARDTPAEACLAALERMDGSEDESPA